MHAEPNPTRPHRRPIRIQPPPRLPAVVLARDVPDAIVATEMRERRWSRVRRGAYLETPDARCVPPAAGSGEDPDANRSAHVARVAALAVQLRRPVFSHESAAVLWGAALWRTPDEVHVTQPIAPSGRRSADICRHHAVLQPEDVTARDGVRLTTVDRTMADCAMTMSPLAGLVVADSLARRGADRVVVESILDRRRGTNGVRGARWVAEHADAGAESAGETLARYVLLAHGFPRPQLQVPVPVDGRTYWADLGWPEWKVLVEFDGLVKYRELARGVPSEVVVAEKRRQEAMEDAGYAVVRVMHRDLFPATDFIRRVGRKLPRTVVSAMRPRRDLLLPSAFA